MTPEELKKILGAHARWLRQEDGVYRADLSGADLRGADLRYADLRSADLMGADLMGADLMGANLYGAILMGADLRGADLRGADLRRAKLRDADLRGVDLRLASLSGVDLRSVEGFLLLPAQDPRGYCHPHAVQQEDGTWRIRAGCRFLTILEAREHWGANYKGDREIGDMYLYATDWLEKKIATTEDAK